MDTNNQTLGVDSLVLLNSVPFNPSATIATSAAFDSTVATLTQINALNSNVFTRGCHLLDVATGNEYKNVGTPTAVDFESVDLNATITLTSAQILALHTTPITAIAAVTGKSIVVDSYTFKLNFGTIAYTGANNVEYRYTNGSGTKVAADTPSAVLDSSVSEGYAGIGAAGILSVNAPVVLAVPTANPAAGDGTATVTIRYRLV